MRRVVSAFLCVALLSFVSDPVAGSPATRTNARTYTPAVITLQIVRAARAAAIIRAVYPSAAVRVDSATNSVIVIAPPDVLSGARSIAAGIDVRNPTDSVVDTQQVHTASASEVVRQLKPLFPHSRFSAAPNRTILIVAPPSDMPQIKAVIETMDTPLATPTPAAVYPTQAVQVTQRNAKEIARAVAKANPHVRVAVSRGSILLSGPPDMVSQAQTLIGQLDAPQPGVQYTQIYHLHYVDAKSVADLIKRSYPKISVQVDEDLNAITVLADSAIQHRLADAIAQIDEAPGGAGGAQGAVGAGGVETNVVTLKAAVPGLNGAPSTTSTDIATPGWMMCGVTVTMTSLRVYCSESLRNSEPMRGRSPRSGMRVDVEVCES